MRTSVFSAIMLAMLAASAAAVAAEFSGHFYTHVISETKTTLPDGNTAVLSHYYILTASDNNANNPMNHLAGNCSGQSIVSKDGKLLAISGICFEQDADGDSLPHWWKMDEAGTANCPGVCGSFGFLPGTGKFKGITGGGTFKRTHQFVEGSSGSFRETYKMP